MAKSLAVFPKMGHIHMDTNTDHFTPLALCVQGKIMTNTSIVLPSLSRESQR